MDSDAKLNILTEALAAAGASALAIDARGDVAISTMNDAALERDVVTFVAERLDRIGDGARLVMGRAGTRLSSDRSPHRQRGRVPLGRRGPRGARRAAQASSGLTPTKLRPATNRARTASLRGGLGGCAGCRELRARWPLCSRASWERVRSRSPSASIWTVLCRSTLCFRCAR